MPSTLRSLAVALLALAAPAVRGQDPTVPPPPQRQDPKHVPVTIPTDEESADPLELTLLDALRLGRFNNVVLRADELSPLQSAQSVRVAEAFFEPELFATATVGRTERPQQNVFQPAITRESLDGSLGIRQRLATGALYEMTFLPLRLRQSTSTSGFPTQLHTMEFAARVSQPLLRNAWGDAALAEVRSSQAFLTADRARFDATVQSVLLDIVVAYWELVFAREDYRVKTQALALAQEQLRITIERIRVRELAERDRVFDEAEIAMRQEELIRAENEIRRREDLLRQLLFDDFDGRLWQRNLRPVSPFEGDFEVPEIDWREAARIALDARPDIAALRAEVDAAQIAFDEARRNVLPQLDLVASYSTDGSQSSSNAAWRDLTSIEFPDWTIGLELSIPIGNNAAQGVRDRTMLQLEQARRRVFAAELDVAREVRESLRDLATLAESIRAARESVRLAETQLDTERERLRVGRGTTFEVQLRNQELLDARQRLLRNQLDYRISESRLLYVQGLLHAPGVGDAAR